jgi:hypothetical protein
MVVPVRPYHAKIKTNEKDFELKLVMKYLLSRKSTPPTQIRDDFYFMNDYDNVKNVKN